MTASKTPPRLNKTEEKFTLELSFIEMHIIMKAMAEYSSQGYNPRHTNQYNIHHANKAEQLHDELLNVYC